MMSFKKFTSGTMKDGVSQFFCGMRRAIYFYFYMISRRQFKVYGIFPCHAGDGSIPAQGPPAWATREVLEPGMALY